jgi:Protein of unknown function (DUF3710)
VSRFRRRDRNAEALEPDSGTEDVTDSADGASDTDGDDDNPRGTAARAASDRSSGPWDVSEIDDPSAGRRVNMGGMWIPMIDGLEVRVEADHESGQVLAVTLLLDDGAVQLQPFAAPRNEGIWDEVRAELRTGVTRDGGTADEVEGPLGTELRTRAQVRAPNGKTAVEAARFVGVDGPRWFLRGILTGRPAAAPSDADEALFALFRDVVVVRGTGPMAPREPIPLAMPDQVPDVAVEAEEEDPLSPFARGPEITEIH